MPEPDKKIRAEELSVEGSRWWFDTSHHIAEYILALFRSTPDRARVASAGLLDAIFEWAKIIGKKTSSEIGKAAGLLMGEYVMALKNLVDTLADREKRDAVIIELWLGVLTQNSIKQAEFYKEILKDFPAESFRDQFAEWFIAFGDLALGIKNADKAMADKALKKIDDVRDKLSALAAKAF